MATVTDGTTSALGVTLTAVSRAFDDGLLAVDGVSLSIAPGQFVAFLGPSGCGKTTLLRMVAGLDRPTAGEIRIDDGASAGGSIAYVFQDPQLLPWRSVLRNVALPLELRGEARSDRLAAAAEAIERVGLSQFAGHFPSQLSGGMRMRVSLARALVTDPELLLLDEPFAALDELTRHRLDEQLYELWERRGMTVLFVTHSTAEAAFLAQRTIVFSPRPARVVLDHLIKLEGKRDAHLRTRSDYAQVMRTLFDALEE